MAAVKGVNVTLHDAGGQGDNAIENGEVNIQLEVWNDEYEASALASGSTIDIAKLPAGAKVQSVEVYHDALGSSHLDIGDSNDTDRYTLAAVSVSAARSFKSDTADGKNYEVGTASGDDVIQLLTSGAAITGTIKTETKFTR